MLDIHADAATALILADGSDIRRAARHRSQHNRILETPHAASTQEAGDRDLAGVTTQVVSTLDFADPLEFLERRIELNAGRDDREIEYPAAQGPVSVIPLRGGVGSGKKIIAIGASTGGVEALKAVLLGMPSDSRSAS